MSDPACEIAWHTLIRGAPYHAFSTSGVLMSPDLPLERRHHEMMIEYVGQITLIASWFNYITRVADALGVGRD